MPWRTISMSAPTRSATRDSSFMKLMRVASMALAAYLVNSALRTQSTAARLGITRRLISSMSRCGGRGPRTLYFDRLSIKIR